MELLGNEDKCVFNLAHDDIIQDISEYIEARYSFPKCVASVIVTAKPREQMISAAITVAINIIEVVPKKE